MSWDATEHVRAMLSGPKGRDLTTTDRIVLKDLAAYCGARKHGERSYPSLGTLAQQAGKSKRQVQRSILRLEQRAIIERDRTRNGKEGICYRFPGLGIGYKSDNTRIKTDDIKMSRVVSRVARASQRTYDILGYQPTTKEELTDDILAPALYEEQKRTKDTEWPQSPAGLAESLLESLSADTGCFADGWGCEESFAVAADFVPEIFATMTTEDREYFSAMTREEFDDCVFKARYQIDVEHDEGFNSVPYGNVQGTAATHESKTNTRAVAAVERPTHQTAKERNDAIAKTQIFETLRKKYPSIRRRRRPGGDKPHRSLGNAHSC